MHPTRHERLESQLRCYCALETAWLLSGTYPEPGQQVLAGDPEATGLSSRPPTEAGGACRMERAEESPLVPAHDVSADRLIARSGSEAEDRQAAVEERRHRVRLETRASGPLSVARAASARSEVRRRRRNSMPIVTGSRPAPCRARARTLSRWSTPNVAPRPNSVPSPSWRARHRRHRCTLSTGSIRAAGWSSRWSRR